MLTLDLVLILIVVLAVFAAAWRWLPSGYLTATTGSIPAVVIVTQEVFAEQMPALKAILPTDSQPWLLVMFMLLTIAARFRSRESVE
jgi:hypothetical protein